MISSKYLKGLYLKHNKFFSKELLVCFILSYFLACSSEYEIKKASWDSSLDYFSQTEEEFTVTYFVDVGKAEAYVGGILEIYKLPNMDYLDRINVDQIEFFFRVDGLQMLSLIHI